MAITKMTFVEYHVSPMYWSLESCVVSRAHLPVSRVVVQLWGLEEKWGFPYASLDHFLLYQRWLSQLLLEVRVWAKRKLDWRTLLEEVGVMAVLSMWWFCDGGRLGVGLWRLMLRLRGVMALSLLP